MASIKFYLLSEKPNASVYLRFSTGRQLELRQKTGVTIPSPKEDWSQPKNLPKTNTAENKNLNSKLKKLSDFILGKYNEDYNDNTSDPVEFNRDWLRNCIDTFFNRVQSTEKDYFLEFAKEFVKEMPRRSYIVKGVKRPYSPITIEKYQNVVNHLEEFEKFKRKRYKIIDITDSFTNEFNDYLKEEKRLSINTIGRDIKRVKTIILEAEKTGHKISHKVKEIKGFEDEKIVVYLTFDEIDKIKETSFSDDKLIRAKEWLIIGCFTGQRISDLWRMRKSMIIQDNGFKYITFKQFKTGKSVKIPVHWEVEPILEKYGNDFPPMFSNNEKSNRTELSNLIKKVCQQAGIDDMIEARYNGIKGLYPKYQLIGNHSCRRSFASNFYGNPLFPTPMLMEITGHVKESNFLTYIGEEEHRFSEQIAKNFEIFRQQLEAKKNENSKLKIV